MANVTGVVAALHSEARCLGPRRGATQGSGLARGDAGGELMVRISGMGCARAARAAHELVRAGARSLLCWGVAGALDPSLRCGDVVLASEVICQTPLALHLESMRPTALPARARLRTCDAWRDDLRSALLRQGSVVCGPMLTAAELVCDAPLKARLFHDSGAVAVDMESAAVGAVAQLHDVPFMALRVIADTAADTLPGLLRLIAGAQSLGPLAWLGYLPLLCAPMAWPGLARLGRRYRLALHVLQQCARGSRAAPPALSTLP